MHSCLTAKYKFLVFFFLSEAMQEVKLIDEEMSIVYEGKYGKLSASDGAGSHARAVCRYACLIVGLLATSVVVFCFSAIKLVWLFMEYKGM